MEKIILFRLAVILICLPFCLNGQSLKLRISDYNNLANDSLVKWYENANSIDEINFRKNSSLKYTLANDLYKLKKLKVFSVPYIDFKKKKKRFKCNDSLLSLLDFRNNIYDQIVNVYVRKKNNSLI